MLQWICQVVMVSQFLRLIRHPLCIKSPALPHDLFHRRAKHEPSTRSARKNHDMVETLFASLKIGSKLFFDKDRFEIFPAPSLPPANYLQVTSPNFEISTSWLALFTVKPFTWHYPTLTARGVKGSRRVYVFHGRSMFQQCLFAKFQDVTLLFAQTSLHTTHTFKRFHNQNCSKRHDEIFKIEVASIPTKT